jgi:WD40 repeat protein
MDTTVLLAGTRNGDIIKLELNLDNLKDKFFPTVITKNHSTQDLPERTLDNRYLRMAMHPQLSIMATVGRDKTLCIWNINDKTIMERYFLGSNVLPTCLKYNPDGTMLCIGFQDGNTKLYQSKITEIEYKREANGKTLLIKETLKPDLVQLEVLKVNEKSIIVVDIEFSENGSYLAISFDYKQVP